MEKVASFASISESDFDDSHNCHPTSHHLNPPSCLTSNKLTTLTPFVTKHHPYLVSLGQCSSLLPQHVHAPHNIVCQQLHQICAAPTLTPPSSSSMCTFFTISASLQHQHHPFCHLRVRFHYIYLAPTPTTLEVLMVERKEGFCRARKGVVLMVDWMLTSRQMGFEDANEVPELCILAQEYLKKSKGCDESIFEYISSANVENTDSLYVKLADELEICILSYLAFHWNQATSVISQVLGVESQQKKKLKGILLAATRTQRFERVTKNLKVTRVISTLVEEMKAINGDPQCTEVMVPMAHSERSPVLLLMGGGMGAGKSTVLKEILKESFWSGAASNAVVVEADAFKESDVIYRALSSRGHHDDMLQTAELVHQSSTDAASSLLVTALNEGRDVIMDGTLSWEPFVKQTIAMAREVHKHRYRMGVGYKVAEDGTITEDYWEQVKDAEADPPKKENDAEEEHQSEEISNGEAHTRKPYRIELVGVVCDGYLAVVRGIRRAIMTGRAVRVNSQLKSHKRFANAFRRYCELVDNARLYSTNAVGGPPKLIGRKDGDHNLLVDPEDIKCLERLGSLNAEADSIYELHKEPSPINEPGSVWNDIVMSPSRKSNQKELRESIQKIEKSIRKM